MACGGSDLQGVTPGRKTLASDARSEVQEVQEAVLALGGGGAHGAVVKVCGGWPAGAAAYNGAA